MGYHHTFALALVPCYDVAINTTAVATRDKTSSRRIHVEGVMTGDHTILLLYRERVLLAEGKTM